MTIQRGLSNVFLKLVFQFTKQLNTLIMRSTVCSNLVFLTTILVVAYDCIFRPIQLLLGYLLYLF